MQLLGFNWDEEKAQLKERIGRPASVMKRDGDNHALGRLCKLLSHNDDTRKYIGSLVLEFQLYSMQPDHSGLLIDFYSKEGDLDTDCFAGRGTNLFVGTAR